MEYFVNSGAKLKCPWGSEQSGLDVAHPGNPVILCGKLMAIIADSRPLVNIKPFGQCSSTANPAVVAATAANYGRLQKMPCVPVTPSPWLGGKMDLIINGSPALLSTSKCVCSWSSGRLIEVAYPGQDSVYDGGPMSITVNEPTAETLETLGMGLQSSNGIGAGVVAYGAIASGSQTSQSVAKPQSTATATATATKTLIREVRGASDAYPRQEIEYEVSRYNKEKSDVSDYDRNRVRWALKVDGSIGELSGKKGEKITLEIEDCWAGKEIVVMACLEGFNESVSQKTNVGHLSQRTLISGVKGPAEANPGQDVEYEISSYNKDRNSVSNGDKNRIRWAVIFDNRLEELNDKKGKEKIVVKIREEWAGKDIAVLACIEGFNSNVHQRTEVRKIPPVGFMPGNFATMDEAGKFAIHNINQRSIDMNKEFGGRIYELKGRFYITFPKEGHEGYTGSLPESYLGGKLVAWYHTHGNSEEEIDQEFSAYDIAVTDEYRIVAYLGTTINKYAVQKYALNAPLVPQKEENIDENYLNFLKKNGYISVLQ